LLKDHKDVLCEYISFNKTLVKKLSDPSLDKTLDFLNQRAQVEIILCCFHCSKSLKQPNYCSGCRAACYCNEACQRAHWKAHKSECQKIKARFGSHNERAGGGASSH
jgi:hypothetical protein